MGARGGARGGVDTEVAIRRLRRIIADELETKLRYHALFLFCFLPTMPTMS